MMFYMQGQNLCEVVNVSKDTQAAEDTNEGLCKWKIKASKVMFTFKSMIKGDMLEHIWDVIMPKEAWDILACLFSKKNDTKL